MLGQNQIITEEKQPIELTDRKGQEPIMPISVGVIGCGYWGPNIIRNFEQIQDSEVAMVADLDDDRLDYIKSTYPSVNTTKNYEDIIKNSDIEAVAIVTPVFTHKKFAIEAIRAGKHVFVEKPMTASVTDAKEILDLAAKQDVRCMVGHTYEYNPAVIKMKEIIDSGELGDIYYISAQRLNLGLFQQDINVVWDLAPHDISIILYLIGKEPLSVSTFGTSHINPSIQDVAVLNMTFKDNLIAFVQSSWLDPNKVRKITVVGFDIIVHHHFLRPNNKIWLFDKGVEVPDHYDTFAEFQYSYRYGDIQIPKIDNQEPLKVQLQHFLDCIKDKKTPNTDAASGLRVVKILAAAQHSIDNSGRCVLIQ